MFDDLGLTLRKILDDATVPPSLAGVEVSFKTPDKAFSPSVTTLDVFLSGVRENRMLRDPEPILDLVGGSYVRRTPPLRVDCDFLVTAWSKKTDDAAVAEEQLILANALRKLSRFPTIPPIYLQNSLVGQPFPVPMWVAQSGDGMSLDEFWTALGISPRTSFRLVVTIAMDLEVTSAEGPQVITSEIDLDDDLDPGTPGEPMFAIGGVVRDPAGTVAGAVVTVTGGRAATTDADGRFRLSGLVAGEHILRATATGHVPREEVITVPATAPDGYDITFPP
ncbi:Pvc16 family protein [Nocardia asiatica]|uniref:Pvc16 family protein n=1 Tax=Nocardia asiatica TaxID=209252 RepID=UPI0024552B35|nr:Pvc16 family protein [Nocardia asiatica]